MQRLALSQGSPPVQRPNCRRMLARSLYVTMTTARPTGAPWTGRVCIAPRNEDDGSHNEN
eukprot:6971489-Prymnesium_polylepis.2